MRFRTPILTICAVIAFAGCNKDPFAVDEETPQPTPTPRPIARVTPYPHVTPWAPISRNGPDTTWLYRQPTPTPVPSNFKPFHSSLDGSSLMNSPQPGSNPQPGSTPKPFHSSLDDPPQHSGGK
jgi:hypothetical protein